MKWVFLHQFAPLLRHCGEVDLTVPLSALGGMKTLKVFVTCPGDRAKKSQSQNSSGLGLTSKTCVLLTLHLSGHQISHLIIPWCERIVR